VFEHAFTALKHMPETRDAVTQAIDLRLLLEMPLVQSGQMRRLLENIQEADKLVRKVDDPLRKGRVLALLCEAHGHLGNTQVAYEVGRQAVAAAEALGRGQLIALSKLLLSQECGYSGRYREGAKLSAESAEAGSKYIVPDDAEKRGGTPSASKRYARYTYCWAQSSRVLCLAELGAFEQAWASAEQALAVAQPLGMYYPLAASYACAAFAYLRAGEIERGLALIENSVDVARRADLPMLLVQSDLAAGYGYVLAQRYEQGIGWLEGALHRDAANGETALVAFNRAHLAQCYQGTGRAAEALTTAMEAIDLARRYQKLGQEAWAHFTLAGILVLRDAPDLASAQSTLHESLRLARDQGMRPLEAQCLLELSSLPGLPSEQRREHLTTARRMFREMGMQYWLEKAEAVLALGAPTSQ